MRGGITKGGTREETAETADVAGRTAVVTGAAHGLGRAIARGLARAGVRVHAWDIREEELEVTARDFRTANADDPAVASGSVEPRVVDVTDTPAVSAAIDAVVAEGPGLQILVNCAGGVLDQVGRPVEEVARGDFDAIVAVNLTGVFNTVRAAAPAMKSQRYGRIVNISSGAGLGVSKTGIQAYAAAKAGQIGLTRQLAHELGPFGITVNCVAPGFVRSNPATERQWQAYGPEGQEALVQGIALRRLGTPADIAEAVLFLASDRASWITGQVLPVDGGK
jgi:3-oxoacyl-[acyl-carrier protein] reductase